jgi:hypothetical protein
LTADDRYAIIEAVKESSDLGIRWLNGKRLKENLETWFSRRAEKPGFYGFNSRWYF